MNFSLLAQLEDDTVFIIVLGAVLVFAIYQLVFTSDGVHVSPKKTDEGKTTDFERQLLEKLDHANDLLVSTRNCILILIILVVVLASLFLIFR